jgi:type I restriction enzyme S subunit
MSFPRYPEYKDSGIKWIGQVPEHWGVSQSRRMFAVRSEPALVSDRMLTASQKYGVLFQSDFVEMEGRRVVEVIMGTESLKHVEPDDFIISMRSFQGGIEWCKLRGSTSFHYVMLKPVKGVYPPFFAHLFKSVTFIQALRTTTDLIRDGQELRYSNFVQVALPLVPIEEQTQIAAFLDRETAKIDVLVAEQQRLMVLLKEKRQAVISHAVTRGLNPDADMKPSGTERLGDVPAHWALTKIKHFVASFEQGWSPQCEGFPVETELEWGVLKVGCVNGGTFRPEENKTLPIELEPVPSLGICKGDLLISRANSRELVGSAAVAQRDYANLLLCDKLYRLRFSQAICTPVFIKFYLSTEMVRGQIELAATGASSSMVNIAQSTILELELALPELHEQQIIVAYLDSALTKSDTLTTETQRAIDLLQERRTALISAAVTGQIDVRSAVASA